MENILDVGLVTHRKNSKKTTISKKNIILFHFALGFVLYSI